MSSEVPMPIGFDAANSALKLMARLQCESLVLVSRRVKAFADLPGTLAYCHSPQDLLTEQVKFWQIAQKHYAECFEHAFSAWPLAVERAIKPEPLSPPAPRRDYLVVSDSETVPAPAAAAKLPSSEAHLPPVKVRRTA